MLIPRRVKYLVFIIGRLQKLEMDGEILRNHKICKLELKLYLSSQMQLLTLFYFEFIFN